MDDYRKLEMLRAMIGDDDEDNVLYSYLEIAGQKIINRAYPYDPDRDTVPDRYGYLQVEIAAYLMNKRGAEGQLSHNENGINRTYQSADVPESMMSQVVPFCGGIGVRGSYYESSDEE